MVKDSLLLQTIKLLSQRLAMLEPFFNKTACLNPEERELIGYCAAYCEMFKDSDPEFIEYLQQKVIPALTKIGIARWPRTELTDLGLRISNRDEETITLDEESPTLDMAEEEDTRQ